MSATIIAFPDEETRDLLLHGYWRPQDVKEGGRLPSAVDRYREGLECKAAENKAYSARIASLRAAGVPPRCLHAVAITGAASLADVAQIPPQNIAKIRNVGRIAMGELKALLLNNGFTLSEAWDEWEARQEARQG
ncbi:hypothetical protein FACS1894141_0500 [Spirochaetia bacterium]|nr:hypothetical protein FACS1894141_0500 [Spirochaetia bacterium]